MNTFIHSHTHALSINLIRRIIVDRVSDYIKIFISENALPQWSVFPSIRVILPNKCPFVLRFFVPNTSLHTRMCRRNGKKMIGWSSFSFAFASISGRERRTLTGSSDQFFSQRSLLIIPNPFSIYSGFILFLLLQMLHLWCQKAGKVQFPNGPNLSN